MNFNNAQKELLNYFTNSKFYRIFFPFNLVLLFVPQIILFISLLGIRLGLFAAILTILMYFGMIFTLAKGNYKMLFIGLILRTVYLIILTIINSRDPYVPFDAVDLLYAILFAMFTYLAYLKITKKGDR